MLSTCTTVFTVTMFRSIFSKSGPSICPTSSLLLVSKMLRFRHPIDCQHRPLRRVMPTLVSVVSTHLFFFCLRPLVFNKVFMTVFTVVFTILFIKVFMKSTPFAGQDARCTYKTSFAHPPDSSGCARDPSTNAVVPRSGICSRKMVMTVPVNAHPCQRIFRLRHIEALNFSE
jgi:hypothetical protein